MLMIRRTTTHAIPKIEYASDEILDMRTANSEVHALDQSVAAVYDLCDGNTSKSKMVAEIHWRT